MEASSSVVVEGLGTTRWFTRLRGYRCSTAASPSSPRRRSESFPLTPPKSGLNGRTARDLEGDGPGPRQRAAARPSGRDVSPRSSARPPGAPERPSSGARSRTDLRRSPGRSRQRRCRPDPRPIALHARLFPAVPPAEQDMREVGLPAVWRWCGTGGFRGLSTAVRFPRVLSPDSSSRPRRSVVPAALRARRTDERRAVVVVGVVGCVVG